MTKLTLACACCLVLTLTGAFVQRPVGTAEISGRVVEAVSGRPFGGVTVHLYRVPDGPTLFPKDNSGHVIVNGFDDSIGPVLTGADGRFSFPRMATGVFEVQAWKWGWVEAKSPLIAVTESQRVADLTLPLAKAAVLSGRVLGERDQPLSGVPVSVLREGSLAGHETFAAEQGTSWTDDRGGYVFSVLPGEYVVAARINMSIGNRETPRAIDPAGRTLVYRTTFYPNMQSPADATRIALRAGDDRSGVNLRLTAEPGFDITGTVTGAGDLNDLWITLSQAADHDSTSTGASPERRYAFQSIRAGTYALRAGKWPEMPSVTHGVAPLVSLPTAPTLWADAQVVITDRPMDVPLQLREGVRISGRIEFDGATSPPSLDVLNKRALVIDRADGEYSDFRGLYLANDRFTTIQLPPGRYLARPQPPEGWYLQSVMAAGRDIATAPLDVGTADIGDVVITFADRPARLTGRVMFERTDRPQRAWVTIFPVDRSLWIDHGRSPRAIQTILTGVSGEYVAELPSGRYYVIATEDAIGNAQTPGVFTALSASATTVTVTDRSTTRQDVRVQQGRR